MIELPEAMVLASQMNEAVRGRRIAGAVAGTTPHKFAFYTGDPSEYATTLRGRQIGESFACGSKIVVACDGYILVLGEGGERIRLHDGPGSFPKKHQLLLEFEDGGGLSVSVQGWGCLLLVPEREVAAALRGNLDRVGPLDDRFTWERFLGLVAAESDQPNMGLKEFMATQSRILGVGNGCLQEILWLAGLHPKRRVAQCTKGELSDLFHAARQMLRAAAEQGGRDTETDLYGQPGRYPKRMDSRHVGSACPRCGSPIAKIAYMGGACYLCPTCQPPMDS